jgi:hypothetical protein
MYRENVRLTLIFSITPMAGVFDYWRCGWLEQLEALGRGGVGIGK